MFGGPFMNLVLAVLFMGIVLCGFGVPQATTTVGSVSECIVPIGETRDECASTDPEAPAFAAGVKPGDRIVSIDGTPIETWDDSRAILRASPDEALAFEVERDGEIIDLTVTPALTEVYVYDADGQPVEDAAGEPRVEQVGFVGIGPASETVRQPVSAVLPAVGDNIARLVTVISNLPERVVDLAVATFGPEERDPNGLIGVIGIGRIAGEISSLNSVPVADRAAALIQLVGGLNVALFVFNLIPLPPLDGGHIAVALIDGIRRIVAKLFRRPPPKPIDAAKVIPVTLAVTVLLGGLTLLLVIADIIKPISIL